MIAHQLKVMQALLSSVVAGGRGMKGTAFPIQPKKPLKLYEFEGSPYCRRVREVLTLLNLDVEIYPCPKGGHRYRDVVKQKGGKLQFPFLIDENTGDQMYESQDIIRHLFKHYGKTAKTPTKYLPSRKVMIQESVATVVSLLRGVSIDKKIINRPAPEQLLELWSFEASPYSRLVREVLTELEIGYILHNVAKERWQDIGPAVMRFKPGKYEPLIGGKREKLLPEMQGKMQLPYLVDPNTNTKLFESAEIIKYLKQQYGKA